MSLEDSNQFDDPSLRALLQRALGAEQAPQRLRNRLEMALVTEPEPVAPRAASMRLWQDRWERWRSGVYASVAAAVLLFGIGLLVLEYQGWFERRAAARAYAQAEGRQRAVEVPVFLAGAMVKTHTACAKKPDHHLVGGNNLTALKNKLDADLGFPVAVVSLGDGWVFKGGGECPIGSARSGHLLFVRDNQVVSIFSLPADSMYAARNGIHYECDFHGVPMAGLVRGAGLYCVVGSSEPGNMPALTLEDVVALRGSILPALPPDPDTGECAQRHGARVPSLVAQARR